MSAAAVFPALLEAARGAGQPHARPARRHRVPVAVRPDGGHRPGDRRAEAPCSTRCGEGWPTGGPPRRRARRHGASSCGCRRRWTASSCARRAGADRRTAPASDATPAGRCTARRDRSRPTASSSPPRPRRRPRCSTPIDRAAGRRCWPAIDYADVTLVTLQMPDGGRRPPPRRHRLPRARRGRDACITACTWLTSKWPRAATSRRRPAARLDGPVRRRPSRRPVRRRARPARARGPRPHDGPAAARRLDVGGDALARRPSRSTPWATSSACRRSSDAVARLPGLALAGAAFHGVGIPACIASGRRGEPRRPCSGGAVARRAGRPPVSRADRRPSRRRGTGRATAPRPGRNRPRRGRVVVPSLVAGVGLALSLPPWGFWVLAFPAAGAVVVAARRPAPPGPRAGGVVAGARALRPRTVVGHDVQHLRRRRAHGARSPWPPPWPARWSRAGARGRTAALAGAMVLTEALRSTWPFGGLPMGGIALGQASGPLAGAARLGGPLLLVGLVWLGGAGARPWWRRRRGMGATRARLGGRDVAGRSASAAPRVADRPGAWWSGIGRGGRGRARRRPGRRTRSGWRRSRAEASAGLRKSEVDPATVTAAQFAATARRSPPTTGAARRRSWCGPRTWCPSTRPSTGRRREDNWAPSPSRLHATLLVGVTETVSTSSFRNEIVAFSPAGALVARFEKVHRVPFGEYIPYRGFFKHLANLSSVPLDAIPGPRRRRPAHPGRPARDARVLRGLLRATADGSPRAPGPQLLVVPTNTSSYLHQPGPDPGDRRGPPPGDRRRPRPRPGRPHRLQRRDRPPGRVVARSALGGPRRHRPRRGAAAAGRDGLPSASVISR